MRKILRTILLSFIAVLLFPKPALGFGITPAEIYVEDLKPGGYYEAQIYVTRPPDEVSERLTVELDTSELGEMEGWFKFVPGKQFPFPTGKNVSSFQVMVDIPQDTDIRNYQGQITAKGHADDKAGAGVTIIKGAVLGINITTSDADISKLKILSMEAPDVNAGDPVRLILNVENLGNVAAVPDRVDLEVMDLFEEPMESLTTSSLDEIEPFTTKKIQANFNSNLEVGQYRIDASVIFKDKEIFRKRMVLTVNAKPSKVTEEEREAEAQRREALLRGQDYYRLGLALIALGGLLLALILLLIFKKVTVSKPKYAAKLSKKIQKDKKFAWVMIMVSLMLMAVGMYLYLRPQPQTTQTQEGVVVETTTEAVPEETVDQEEVKGLSTQETIQVKVNTGDSTGLVIERPGTPGLYPIFEEPSFSSEIVYEAQDGEIFDATAVEDKWYMVVLEDGTSGWLHETTIKSQ